MRDDGENQVGGAGARDEAAPHHAFRRARGDLAQAYAAVDWAATPLGHPDDWSPALLGATDMLLGTRFPTTLLWGPDYRLVYNEAYVELIGDKHPWALGRTAEEIFPEAWPVIGPMMQRVTASDDSEWVVDSYLPLHRHGFLEECWFTYCYSAVRAVEGGASEGIIDIAYETTERVLAERRIRLLERLRATLADEDDPAQVPARALEVLREDRADLAAVAITRAEDGPPPEVRGGPGDGELLTYPLATTGSSSDRLALHVRLSAMLLADDAYLGFLRLIAATTAQALDRIHALHAERQTLAAQRAVTEALQRDLLGTLHPGGGLVVAAAYQPAVEEAQLGGDWYDAFPLPSGATAVVVGDVAGHDQRAAASMAQVRNVLRGIAAALPDEAPAALTSALDRALVTGGADLVATAVVARAERLADGTVRFAWTSAGHLPPVVVDEQGTARLLLTVPDLVLGLEPSLRRGEHAVDLAPGSTVVLCTDGLVERRTAPIEDGLEWLRSSVEQAHLLDPEQVCQKLLAEVGAVEDDLALLVLRT